LNKPKHLRWELPQCQRAAGRSQKDFVALTKRGSWLPDDGELRLKHKIERCNGAPWLVTAPS